MYVIPFYLSLFPSFTPFIFFICSCHFFHSFQIFIQTFSLLIYLLVILGYRKKNLYLAQKYVLGIFVCRHYLFQEQFFGEWNSKKTVSSEKQMMSKDKINNMHIFSCNIEAIVVIILWIFCKLCGKVFMNSLLYAAWDVFFFLVHPDTT